MFLIYSQSSIQDFKLIICYFFVFKSCRVTAFLLALVGQATSISSENLQVFVLSKLTTDNCDVIGSYKLTTSSLRFWNYLHHFLRVAILILVNNILIFRIVENSQKIRCVFIVYFWFLLIISDDFNCWFLDAIRFFNFILVSCLTSTFNHWSKTLFLTFSKIKSCFVFSFSTCSRA